MGGPRGVTGAGGPRADLVQLGVVDEVGPVPVDERAEAEAVLPAVCGERETVSARRRHPCWSDVASNVLLSDLVLGGPVYPLPAPHGDPSLSTTASAPGPLPGRPRPPAQFGRENWQRVDGSGLWTAVLLSRSVTEPRPRRPLPSSPVSVLDLSPESAP